jgi:hypothetical protein
VPVLNDERKVTNASRIPNTWLEVTITAYRLRHCASCAKSKKTYTIKQQQEKEDDDAFLFISIFQHSHNISRHIHTPFKSRKNAKKVK